MIKNVFFFLLTHFSVGLILSVFFISLKEIGKLFFRVTTFVSFILLLFALISQPFGSVTITHFFSLDSFQPFIFQKLTYVFLAITMLLILVYNVLLPSFHKVILGAISLFGLLGIASYSLAISQLTRVGTSTSLLVMINGLGAALILGSVLGAMITGHWYLVQHNLSLTPLKRSSLIYITSVVLRMVALIMTTLWYWHGVKSLLNFSMNGYLFMGRLAFGLIIPLIFGFMVWSSAKIRSTQSATGILYATIILVLVGETFSRFLFFMTGIPV